MRGNGQLCPLWVRGGAYTSFGKNNITWLIYFLQCSTNKDKYIGPSPTLSNTRSPSSSEWVFHMFTLVFVFS